MNSLELDQIEALAAILVALGKVHKERRLGTLAAACQLYLDVVAQRRGRPAFRRLIEKTGLADS